MLHFLSPSGVTWKLVPSGLAWSLYECAALWRAVCGSFATGRILGTIHKEKGISSQFRISRCNMTQAT